MACVCDHKYEKQWCQTWGPHLLNSSPCFSIPGAPIGVDSLSASSEPGWKGKHTFLINWVKTCPPAPCTSLFTILASFESFFLSIVFVCNSLRTLSSVKPRTFSFLPCQQLAGSLYRRHGTIFWQLTTHSSFSIATPLSKSPLPPCVLSPWKVNKSLC